MAELNLVYQLYQKLSVVDKEAFQRMIDEGTKLTEILSVDSIEKFLKDNRFENGEVCCVHCGCTDIKRNGTRNGRQRFYCKGCHKSFGYATKTIFNSAKKDMDTYLKYIHCMMLGLTVRQTAQECHITKNNSFHARHRFLDSLNYEERNTVVDGIVEGDETYTILSFKGNHSQSPYFDMPRESKQRGTPAKKRGISDEQVCIACSVNAEGTAYSKVCTFGRPSTHDISKVLGGHIAEDALFCTDEHPSYVKFAQDAGINIVQINSKRHSVNGFGVQHVNAYHRKFKDFIRHLCGVATKYLDNYLAWLNILHVNGDSVGKETRLGKIGARMVYLRSRRTFAMRPAIPLAVAA